MADMVRERIYRVISDVFGVPFDQISDDASPDSIPTWDSMNHINLILALEAEFEISLDSSEATEMLSVGLIRAILAERGITDGGQAVPN